MENERQYLICPLTKARDSEIPEIDWKTISKVNWALKTSWNSMKWSEKYGDKDLIDTLVSMKDVLSSKSEKKRGRILPEYLMEKGIAEEFYISYGISANKKANDQQPELKCLEDENEEMKCNYDQLRVVLDGKEEKEEKEEEMAMGSSEVLEKLQEKMVKNNLKIPGFVSDDDEDQKSIFMRCGEGETPADYYEKHGMALEPKDQPTLVCRVYRPHISV